VNNPRVAEASASRSVHASNWHEVDRLHFTVKLVGYRGTAEAARHVVRRAMATDRDPYSPGGARADRAQ